jgi:hypothetical protein
MIRLDTALVLGAGASMDYGFPSGKELMEDIINYLEGYVPNAAPLKKKFGVALTLQQYYEEDGASRSLRDCFEKVDKFQRALRFASPASIDDFIHKNREEGFDIIGKICIALSISNYEEESEDFFTVKTLTGEQHRYYARKSHDYMHHLEVKNGWYQYLWKKIYEDCRDIDEIEDSMRKLLFITFNYDRTLEHFLYTRLINMLGMSRDKARAAFRKSIFIHHVYGQIGSLEWQDEKQGNPYGPVKLDPIFNCLPDGFIIEDLGEDLKLMSSRVTSEDKKCIARVLSLARGIRTYTETNISPLARDSFPLRVLQPKSTFFLGFGYHPQNIEWLKSLFGNPSATLYGTTLGCGSYEKIVITNKLREAFPNARVEDRLFNASEFKIAEYFSNVMDIV